MRHLPEQPLLSMVSKNNPVSSGECLSNQTTGPERDEVKHGERVGNSGGEVEEDMERLYQTESVRKILVRETQKQHTIHIL